MIWFPKVNYNSSVRFCELDTEKLKDFNENGVNG